MNVLHLLALEWRRFAPNATFRVLIFLYVLIFGLVTYATRLIGSTLAMSPGDYLFASPALWQFVAYLGSWLNFSLLGLCGVFLITTDWTHRTLRQSVIFGMTRGEVAASKIASAVALSMGATGLYVLVCVVAGWLVHTSGTSSVPMPNLLSGVQNAWPFFLQALGCIVIGVLFGLVIRQTALATLAYLAYIFILESLFRWIILLTVIKTRAVLFLPDSLLESLTPFPMPKITDQLTRSYQFIIPLAQHEVMLGAGAWIVLLVILIQWKIRRADL